MWQNTWFYYKDILTSDSHIGIPIYTGNRVEPPKTLRLAKIEKTKVDILVDAFVGIKRVGVDGIDLVEVFITRCI